MYSNKFCRLLKLAPILNNVMWYLIDAKKKIVMNHPMILMYSLGYIKFSGRHVRDSMVVGFTTTYAISAYHH
jgi:hypothetical protein